MSNRRETHGEAKQMKPGGVSKLYATVGKKPNEDRRKLSKKNLGMPKERGRAQNVLQERESGSHLSTYLEKKYRTRYDNLGMTEGSKEKHRMTKGGRGKVLVERRRGGKRLITKTG